MLACVPWFHLHTTIHTGFHLHTTMHTRFRLHTTIQTRFHLLIRCTIHTNRGFLAANHPSQSKHHNILCENLKDQHLYFPPPTSYSVATEQKMLILSKTFEAQLLMMQDISCNQRCNLHSSDSWNRLTMKQLCVPVHKVPLSGKIKSLCERQGLKAQRGILYTRRLIITLPRGSLLKKHLQEWFKFQSKTRSQQIRFLLCELWFHSKSILNTQWLKSCQFCSAFSLSTAFPIGKLTFWLGQSGSIHSCLLPFSLNEAVNVLRLIRVTESLLRCLGQQ